MLLKLNPSPNSTCVQNIVVPSSIEIAAQAGMTTVVCFVVYMPHPHSSKQVAFAYKDRGLFCNINNFYIIRPALALELVPLKRDRKEQKEMEKLKAAEIEKKKQQITKEH